MAYVHDPSNTFRILASCSAANRPTLLQEGKQEEEEEEEKKAKSNQKKGKEREKSKRKKGKGKKEKEKEKTCHAVSHQVDLLMCAHRLHHLQRLPDINLNILPQTSKQNKQTNKQPVNNNTTHKKLSFLIGTN